MLGRVEDSSSSVRPRRESISMVSLPLSYSRIMHRRSADHMMYNSGIRIARPRRSKSQDSESRMAKTLPSNGRRPHLQRQRRYARKGLDLGESASRERRRRVGSGEAFAQAESESLDGSQQDSVVRWTRKRGEGGVGLLWWVYRSVVARTILGIRRRGDFIVFFRAEGVERCWCTTRGYEMAWRERGRIRECAFF